MPECIKCGKYVNPFSANTSVEGISCCFDCLSDYQTLLLESISNPVLFHETIAKWRRQRDIKIHKLFDFGVTIEEYPLLLGLFQLSLAKGKNTVFFLNKHFDIKEVAEFLNKE